MSQLVQKEALFMWLPFVGSLVVFAVVLWRVLRATSRMAGQSDSTRK